MRRLTACIVLISLGGCVETVRFRAVEPTVDNVARALSAEQALTHPMTVAMREGRPANDRQLSICLRDGSVDGVELDAVRVDGDRVCGVPLRDASGSQGENDAAERCWALSDLKSVGVPRDARTIGYYPVRGWLDCGKTS